MSISSSNSRQSANGSSSSNYRSTTGNKSSCNASGNASGNASAVDRTPCCPHCTNVNKFMNQNLPTDHWLRETADPKSRVVCKELMATECRFCHNHGHTRSQCPALLDKNSATPVATPAKPINNNGKSNNGRTHMATFKSKNVFENLQESDDEMPAKKMAKTTDSNPKECTAQAMQAMQSSKPNFDFPVFSKSSSITDQPPVLNFAKAILTTPNLVKTVAALPPMTVTPKTTSSSSMFKPISISNRCKWAESDSGEDDLTEEYIALQRAREQDFASAQRGRVNSWGDTEHPF